MKATRCCGDCSGVHLLDLTYVEDGNPNVLHGQINITKRLLIHEVISEVLQFQDIPYRFITLLEVKKLLPKSSMQPDKSTDEELFNRSLRLEPRGWDGEGPVPRTE